MRLQFCRLLRLKRRFSINQHFIRVKSQFTQMAPVFNYPIARRDENLKDILHGTEVSFDFVEISYPATTGLSQLSLFLSSIVTQMNLRYNCPMISFILFTKNAFVRFRLLILIVI